MTGTTLIDYAEYIEPYMDQTESANRHNDGTTIWVSRSNNDKLIQLGRALRHRSNKHRASGSHALAALLAYLEDA